MAMALDSSSGRGGSDGSSRLGQRRAAERERHDAVGGSSSRRRSSGPEDQLGRAAADVDHEQRQGRRGRPRGRRPADGPARHHPGEAQPGLGRRAQHLGRVAERGLGHGEQLLDVAGRPGRCGGHHPDHAGLVLVDEQAVVPEHARGPLERVRLEPSRAAEPFGQPGDLGAADDGGAVAANEEAGRVGPDVDRRAGGGRWAHGRLVGQPGGDPSAHGVVPTGQEPGVVRVEALHADPGAAHPSARGGAGVVRGHGGIALGGVAGVSVRHGFGGHLGLGPADTAGGLQPADHGGRVGTDQPVARRHRGAVVQQGSVADDHGRPGTIAHDHLEPTLRLPTEQGRHGRPVRAVVGLDQPRPLRTTGRRALVTGRVSSGGGSGATPPAGARRRRSGAAAA